MAAKTYAQIQNDLAGFLSVYFPDMTVSVGHSERWGRTCLTFRWSGFDELLVEERFRQVARLVPPDYFEEVCRDAVWLELGANESLDDYLARPRSEDIDGRLPAIWRMLNGWDFFAALEDELVRLPLDQCPDDLSVSKRVLRAKQATPQQMEDACLAFIRHAAYTDWEVLREVRPLAEPPAKPRARKR